MLKAKKSVFLILLLVAGLVFFSGCRRHGPGHGAEFMVDYVAETLDLDDAQRAKLESIKDELLQKHEEMRTDKEAMHAQAKVLLLSDHIDETAVRAMVNEHRERMNSAIDLVITRFIEFHNMLTPEQKAKLVSKLEQFENYHHKF